MKALNPLPYVSGLYKMTEVISACIYHNALFPYQRPAKDTKVMPFLINLCDRGKLPVFFCFYFFLKSARGRKLLCFTSDS